MRSRLVLVPAILAAAFAAAPLQAVVTSSVSGTSATMTGDATSEVIEVWAEGGTLRHNRFDLGDPGFNSAADFDSSVAGNQTVAADSGSSVNISGGTGVDTIKVGNTSFGAHLINAVITCNNGGGEDVLRVDLTGAEANAVYEFRSNGFTGPGVNIPRPGTFSGGVVLDMSSGPDTINVISTFSSEKLWINGRSGADTVVLGAGGTAYTSISSEVNISNPSNFTDVLVDASAGSATQTWSYDPPTLMRTGGKAITLNSGDIDDFELRTGTADDTITVAGAAGGIVYKYDTGTGADTVNLAGFNFDSGTVQVSMGEGDYDDTVLVSVGGDARTVFTLEGGAETTADKLTIDGSTGLLYRVGDGLQYPSGGYLTWSGFEDVTLQNLFTLKTSVSLVPESGVCEEGECGDASVVQVPVGREPSFCFEVENHSMMQFMAFDLRINGREPLSFQSLLFSPGSTQLVRYCGADLVSGNQDIFLRIHNGGGPDRTFQPQVQVFYQPPDEDLIVVTENDKLFTFHASNPTTPLTDVTLSGLSFDEHVIAIDCGPTGQLFGLTTDDRLTMIDYTTGECTPVGSGAIAAIPAAYASIDFIAPANRIRMIASDGQNLRLNPDGTLAATDVAIAYAPGDLYAGMTPQIEDLAYTDPEVGGTSAAFYGLDVSAGASPRLVTSFFPNTGEIVTYDYFYPAIPVTPGRMGMDFGPSGIGYVMVNNYVGMFSLERCGVTALGPTPSGGNVVDMCVLIQPPPEITIDDVAVTEGDSGMKQVQVAYSITRPSAKATFDWQTSPVTATAEEDYVSAIGANFSFPDGATTGTLTIDIIGDSLPEYAETFVVTLSNMPRLVAAKSEAIVTILNDDPGAPVAAILTGTGPEAGDDFNEDGVLDAADAVSVP